MKRRSGYVKKPKRARNMFRPTTAGIRWRPPLRLSTSGFPTQKVVSLRYAECVGLNAGAGVIASYAFRANSIFDPNSTGTGHQPYAHDQWAILYNHYVVLGSKITVHASVSNTTGQYQANGIVGIHLDDDGTLPGTTTQEMMELPRTKYSRVNLSSVSNKGVRVSKNYSARRFHGIKDVKDNINRIGAAVGANPTEQAYFVIWYGSTDSAEDSTSLALAVQIDYIIQYTEPKDLTTS